MIHGIFFSQAYYMIKSTKSAQQGDLVSIIGYLIESLDEIRKKVTTTKIQTAFAEKEKFEFDVLFSKWVSQLTVAEIIMNEIKADIDKLED
jgi:hypothetical protein